MANQMSDEELLEELHILGQWLQGLGVGPQPAEMDRLLMDTLSQLLTALYRVRQRRKEMADERAARN